MNFVGSWGRRRPKVKGSLEFSTRACSCTWGSRLTSFSWLCPTLRWAYREIFRSERIGGRPLVCYWLHGQQAGTSLFSERSPGCGLPSGEGRPSSRPRGHLPCLGRAWARPARGFPWKSRGCGSSGGGVRLCQRPIGHPPCHGRACTRPAWCLSCSLGALVSGSWSRLCSQSRIPASPSWRPDGRPRPGGDATRPPWSPPDAHPCAPGVVGPILRIISYSGGGQCW